LGSERDAGREFIRNGRKPAQNVTYILMLIPTATFSASFQERKVDCCDVLRQVESIFKKCHFSTIYVYHKRRQILGQDLLHDFSSFDLEKFPLGSLSLRY
jgi:hypothetical protein